MAFFCLAGEHFYEMKNVKTIVNRIKKEGSGHLVDLAKNKFRT